ncbi:DUF935 family protein [Micromonospora chalcea]|uniref:phage portal protein family protein n=1 Tax=Micromonospora chalcea TaxID=1874 RepID=UPI0037F8ED4A
MVAIPSSLRGYAEDSVWGTALAEVREHISDLVFPLSVSTYAQMRRDSTLAAILQGWTFQLRRAQWQLDGAACREEVTRLVADDMGLPIKGADAPAAARVRGVSWNEHLRASLLMLPYGFSAFEMLAEMRGGRARLIALAERMPHTIAEIHADPKTGAFLGITQEVTAATVKGKPQIPADRMVFYCHEREGASWFGSSLLRPAFAPWLLKRELMRVLATSSRRFGMGVPTVEWAPGSNPTPAQYQEGLNAAAAARVGDQSGLTLPPGARLVLAGMSGSTPDTLAYIKWLDAQMSRSALMSHLDLGHTETGSRALGSVFVDSWTLALESVAEAVADVATRQIAARIVGWNWGEDEPVPRVVVSGIGSRREVTAESLQMLLAAGALASDPALEEWVRREWRLPEREAAPTPPAPLPVARPDRPADAPRVEAAAPAAPPVDVTALDAAHDKAVQDMTGQWQGAAGPLVTALAAAVAAETAGGALAGLASLAVPGSAVTALTGVVSAGLLAAASSAAVQAAAEVRPIRSVDGGLGADGRARIADLARGTVDLIVAGYRSAASRVAMGHTGADTDEARVRAAVADALTDLSEQKTAGLVAGSLSDAVLSAQGIGREQVLAGLPDGTRFAAGETRDRNTCPACRDADGTEYESLVAALAARPTGRNPACAGGLRCRGFIYAIAG